MWYAVFVKHGIFHTQHLALLQGAHCSFALKCIFEQQKQKTKFKKPKADSNLLKCLQIKLLQFIQKSGLCCCQLHLQ